MSKKLNLEYACIRVSVKHQSDGIPLIKIKTTHPYLTNGLKFSRYFEPGEMRKLAAFLTEQAKIAEGKGKTEKLHVEVGKTYEDAAGGLHKIIYDDRSGSYQFFDASGRFYSETGKRLGANGPDLVREVSPKPKPEPESAPAEAIADLTKRVEALEGRAEPEPITMKVGEYYVTSMGITVKCTNDAEETSSGRYGCVGVKVGPMWGMDDHGGVNNPECEPGNIVRVATPAERAEFELKREW